MPHPASGRRFAPRSRPPVCRRDSLRGTVGARPLGKRERPRRRLSRRGARGRHSRAAHLQVPDADGSLPGHRCRRHAGRRGIHQDSEARVSAAARESFRAAVSPAGTAGGGPRARARPGAGHTRTGKVSDARGHLPGLPLAESLRRRRRRDGARCRLRHAAPVRRRRDRVPLEGWPLADPTESHPGSRERHRRLVGGRHREGDAHRDDTRRAPAQSDDAVQRRVPRHDRPGRARHRALPALAAASTERPAAEPALRRLGSPTRRLLRASARSALVPGGADDGDAPMTHEGATQRDFEIRRPIATVEYGLVRAHALASLGGVVIAGIFGFLVATKFSAPEFLGRDAALSWGRLRMNHTQGVFFGCLGTAALAFAYYATPRLLGLPVTSRRLGWFLFFLWTLGIVLPGWALVSAGILQPLEWAEFPQIVDAAVIAAAVCAALQFLVPTFRLRVDRLYISSWYLVGGFTFTALAYTMGNTAPLHYPGTQGAACSGLWIHEGVGLYAAPMALAVIYCIIPAVARRPIFSHFLSLLRFWLLFLVSPLNGMHHCLLTPLPMDAQLGAIAASVYMGVDVILVVTNLLLSLRGGAQMVGKDISLRFIVTSVVLYLLASVQGALMSLLPLNRLTHFSDWVIGHSHLALLGFAGFAALGAIGHVWQHTPGARYSRRAMAWAYWLALSGLLLMVVDLTIVGLIQAHLWNLDLPWMTSVAESRPYWTLRAVSGAMLIVSFGCFVIGLITGPRHRDRATDRRSLDLEADLVVPLERSAQATHGAAPSAALIAVALSCFVGGLVFFAFSIVALGIVPGRYVAAEIADSTPAAWHPRTAGEERGREVYARQGCAYCHTQQVRAVEADVRRFGPATENWETREDIPHLWGTRRIGPDLAREAGRRPDDWQRVHLYDPRRVEPGSVMPAYPWLFDGGPDRPTSEATDLVAYLQWLGRPRQERDRDAGEVARAERARQAHMMGGMAMEEIAPVSDGSPPSLVLSTVAGDVQAGAALFGQRCSGCHGAAGHGDGPAAASLLPHPANLTAARFSSQRLTDVLWNGVPGTAMPRFRDVPLRDLRAVASYVASLGGPPAESRGDPRLADGGVLFRVRCAVCTGAEGQGDGPAAARLRRQPADFGRKQPSAERVRAVLLAGIPGSAMTPMQQNMSETERDALVVYVRALFAGEPEGGPVR